MKQQIKSGLVSVIGWASRAGGDRYRRQVRRILSEAVGTMDVSVETVTVAGRTLSFVCMNDFSRWRVASFFDKEPETLSWIDGFQPGDVFWDIGANIGQFTLYAAAKGARVLAFEPSAPNYYGLNANIGESALDDRAKAYCLAFNDDTVVGELGMTTTEFGGALSQFSNPAKSAGGDPDVVFRQGMFGVSIDAFVRMSGAAVPNHIKIDVDGAELKIIQGAEATLQDTRLKSISIELDETDTDQVDTVTRLLGDGGLTLALKAHAPMFDDGPYKTVFNYQFCRT